jgi:hypothetical protein
MKRLIPKVKTHTFNKKKYKLRWAKPRGCDGLCDSPEEKAPEMTINPQAKEQEFLDTCLHEGLHACLWFLSEETVVDVANDLSSFLYKVGFRLNHDATKK